MKLHFAETQEIHFINNNLRLFPAPVSNISHILLTGMEKSRNKHLGYRRSPKPETAMAGRCQSKSFIYRKPRMIREFVERFFLLPPSLDAILFTDSKGNNT